MQQAAPAFGSPPMEIALIAASSAALAAARSSLRFCRSAMRRATSAAASFDLDDSHTSRQPVKPRAILLLIIFEKTNFCRFNLYLMSCSMGARSGNVSSQGEQISN